MRTLGIVLLAIVLAGLTQPAAAQMGPGGGYDRMGGVMGPGMMGGRLAEGERGPAAPGARGQAFSHEGPLISIMLAHREELGLTPEQEQKLRDLRTEATKDSIRRTAEIRVAEVELDRLLEQEAWDIGAIEAKAKQIAALQGDRRVSRLRSLAAGRAVLTPQQLQRLRDVGHRMRGPGGGPGPGMMGPGMMAPGAGGGGPPGPGRP